MIDIVICDNNSVQARALSGMVQELLQAPCSVEICLTAEALRERCAKMQPQIVLLDILLGEKNGIDLAQELFPASTGTAVIFITGYTEYCVDVYQADHVWFLPKPIEREQLRAALNKACSVSREAQHIFSVNVRRVPQRIDLRDVLSIESSYRKLRFRLWNESIECYGSFSELPAFVLGHMIHCHKSFLVNPDYIRTIDGAGFLLMNGAQVPISRNRYRDSRRAFLAFCGKKAEETQP